MCYESKQNIFLTARQLCLRIHLSSLDWKHTIEKEFHIRPPAFAVKICISYETKSKFQCYLIYWFSRAAVRYLFLVPSTDLVSGMDSGSEFSSKQSLNWNFESCIEYRKFDRQSLKHSYFSFNKCLKLAKSKFELLFIARDTKRERKRERVRERERRRRRRWSCRAPGANVTPGPFVRLDIFYV